MEKGTKSHEITQQMMFCHKTGVNVLLSPRATEEIAKSGHKGELPATESERLRAITDDGPLRKRYSSIDEGKDFMSQVDYNRREVLLAYAAQMSGDIVDSWREISDKDIAVILFGSVAKGLVKNTDSPDPSNIDLAVIGEINPDERSRLYDAIRPKRKSIQQKIIAGVKKVDCNDSNPGNVGVTIQDRHKVLNGNYTGAMNYIASCAFALYDEAGIWEQIETEALNRSSEHNLNKRKTNRLNFKTRENDYKPNNPKTEFVDSPVDTECQGDMILAESRFQIGEYPLARKNEPTDFEQRIISDFYKSK